MKTDTCEDNSTQGAEAVAQTLPSDPDLAELMNLWPSLDEGIRAAMMKLARA